MPLSKNIRAILFDLDGTLRHNEPDSTFAFMDYALALGAVDSAEKRQHFVRWTHYYWAQSPELSQDMQIYRTLSDEFWEHYAVRALVELGCSETTARKLAPEMQCRMSEEHKPEDIILPDVFPTLETLKAAGYSLSVVSNRSTSFHEYLQSLALDTYFDLILAAGEVDSWKPDPAIFRHALTQLSLTPDQAIYVGDNYFADVVGARRAGLQPVLIDPQGIFKDPGCPVITRISDLPGILNDSKL